MSEDICPYDDWSILNKKASKQETFVRLLSEIEEKRNRTYASVGDALEFRRDQYRLSRTEFAALLGLSESHYSEIVRGKRRLPINATKRAYAIGVLADVLLQLDAST